LFAIIVIGNFKLNELQSLNNSSQRRRRGIFVEPQPKQNSSPVGAAYSAGNFSTQRRKGAKPQGIFYFAPIASWRLGVNSFTDDAAPTELLKN
jgi:hypothetical protein